VLTPAAPPQAVPVYSGFDYVTVDGPRRRVYAAHSGSRALLVVDADSGAVVGQVRVGAVHGVAVDPASGHVYVGDDEEVSEIDPVALEVLNHVDVGGSVDAIAYDPGNGRIYADEDDGTKLWVVDAKTFKLVKTVALPGHKPEYLAVNPRTHEVYQNIDSESEIAVIDPSTMSVSRTIATPEIKHNHPLQYDPGYDQIVVAGGGVMSAYAPGGTKLGQLAVGRFDQCDLDPTQHVIACAGAARRGHGEPRRPHRRDRSPDARGVRGLGRPRRQGRLRAEVHPLALDGSGLGLLRCPAWAFAVRR
jgi:outer membrane protein assembly factor BamB